MKINRLVFDTLDSTNTWSKREAAGFPRDTLTIVLARGQTAGRGRFTRHWVSPANQNIYVSFSFFIPEQRQDIGHLSPVVGLAIAKCLKARSFNARLKWPNDLHIEGKKVAGVLCETVTLSPERCVIVGVGVNVNMDPEFLRAIDQPATSLCEVCGHALDLAEITDHVLNDLTEAIELFLAKGFEPFFEEYRNFLVHHIGDPITIQDGNRKFQGTYAGLSDKAALLLQLPNGAVIPISSGEIPSKHLGT